MQKPLFEQCVSSGRASSWKLADAVVADTKARSHYAVVKTQAVTSQSWDYMITHMERACLGVYHGMAYLGATFQEAFPRGRSAVSPGHMCPYDGLVRPVDPCLIEVLTACVD